MHAQTTDSLSAQIPMAYNKNDISISIGYGYLYTWKIFDVAYNSNYVKDKVTGPTYVKGEYVVSKYISMGLSIAHVRMVQNYLPNYGNQGANITVYTSWSFLGRVNAHLQVSKIVGIYAGLGIGYRMGVAKYPSNTMADYQVFSPVYCPLGIDCTLGARFSFNKQLGAYTEAGIAKSFLQAGMVYTFNTTQKSSIKHS